MCTLDSSGCEYNSMVGNYEQIRDISGFIKGGEKFEC